MSLVLQSSGGGQITIQEPATASNFTQSLPAATGTVMVSGNQPAFSAFPTSTSQTPTINTFTKVTLGSENFDTNNNFASSTFTPTVAGYYQIDGTVHMNNSVSRLIVSIFKNGVEYLRGFDVIASCNNGTASCVMFMNGSTDYVELYTYNGTGGTLIFTGTQFSGCLVRAA
jgi:hypothetical protein